MGKVYSRVYSMLTRPVRLFNIENRARKVISQEKPKPAPQYAATEKQKRLMDEVNPHFMEGHYKKNVQLDQRLKDVFVTSMDPQEVNEPTKESKSLPQSRKNPEIDFLYEPYETTVIPVGKCSLKQALTFLMQHKSDPVTYSSETIASEYKMDKEVVDDILKHFKLYVTLSQGSVGPVEDPIQELYDESAKEVKRRKDKKEQEDRETNK